ncbi:MAG: alkaline phosphatase family protein [Acidimicrobiia bacterium]
MGAPVEPVKPDYSGANVAGIVPALLGGRRADWLPEPVVGARSTVLLVLDGLGWDAWTRAPECLPELRACTGGPITTVVPSTTPAALTSITTGMAPSRHGITGFRVRVEHSVLNVIRWQQADGKRAPDPASVQRQEVFGGRHVPVVTKSAFRTTGFTGVHLRGADFHGWQTTSALVEHVRKVVAGGARFVYAYYPGVDEIAHAYGLDPPFYTAELAATDGLVGALLDALPGDTALLVTADHGQVHVGPEGWIGLGPLDPMVAAYAGDGRFRYLHARPGAAADLLDAAQLRHREDAWVFSREQLLDEGWLGPEPVPVTRQRVGDVVLAARGGVGFVDPTLPYETELVAAHGSLTPAEMQVPLVAARGRARR